MSVSLVEASGNNPVGCIMFCEQTITDERLPVGRNMSLCRLSGKAIQYRNTANGPIYDQLPNCPFERMADGCQSVSLRSLSRAMHPLREIKLVNNKGAETILIV